MYNTICKEGLKRNDFVQTLYMFISFEHDICVY